MGNDTAIIKDADYSDIDDIVGLLKLLFSIEENFVFNELKQRRGLQLMLDGCGKHRCIKIAEIDNKVIGMITSQSLISTAEGSIVALIEDLVVDVNYQRKGIGTKLLQAILTWAEQREISRLQLLADIKNDGALKFYERQDWSPTQLICLRKKL